MLGDVQIYLSQSNVCHGAARGTLHSVCPDARQQPGQAICQARIKGYHWLAFNHVWLLITLIAGRWPELAAVAVMCSLCIAWSG